MFPTGKRFPFFCFLFFFSPEAMTIRKERAGQGFFRHSRYLPQFPNFLFPDVTNFFTSHFSSLLPSLLLSKTRVQTRRKPFLSLFFKRHPLAGRCLMALLPRRLVLPSRLLILNRLLVPTSRSCVSSTNRPVDVHVFLAACCASYGEGSAMSGDLKL